MTTVVFSVFFFLSACIWASGVSTVKYWTTFDNVKKELLTIPCNTAGNTCEQQSFPNYASINISVVSIKAVSNRALPFKYLPTTMAYVRLCVYE